MEEEVVSFFFFLYIYIYIRISGLRGKEPAIR